MFVCGCTPGMPDGAPDFIGVVLATSRSGGEVRVVVDTSGDRTPDYVVAVRARSVLLVDPASR